MMAQMTENRWLHMGIATLVVLTILVLGLEASAASVSYQEAPMLQEKVAAGELPPVEERLPAEPLVQTPLESIGKYGGEWRMAMSGAADYWSFPRTVAGETLVRHVSEWTGETYPNVAKSVEVNDDATEYTFTLREGMRWSDGHPLTTEDIRFWYEDILKHPEITPSPPHWLTVGGVMGEFEIIDDYTFKIIFPEPYGIFLQQAGTQAASLSIHYMYTLKPKHYMKQFHPSYATEEELARAVQEEGVARWIELWDIKGTPWRNAELPTLNPWVVVEGYTQGEANRVIWERNPYYFKVDPEGNQLPYIDRVTFEVVENLDVLSLMAMDGEIDMQIRHLGSLEQLPLFHQNAERGGYRIFEALNTNGNAHAYSFNLNHRDEVLKEIFHDVRFRQAMSHAIDRQRIIDLTQFGIGEPRQNAPLPGTPFYSEELEKAHIEYDPDLANRLLDEMGLTERNADGIRLRPDGQPLRLLIDVVVGQTERIDATELVVEDWRSVGVEARTNVIDRSFFLERSEALNHDVAVWGMEGAYADILLRPLYFVPWEHWSLWGVGYAEWRRTDGQRGEEPPEAMKRTIELFNRVQSSPNFDEQVELIHQILDINRENLWSIGIATPPNGYGIVKHDFRNVPETMVVNSQIGEPNHTNPETYFWDR